MRIEQIRAEVLERIERLDRRSGQMELRLIRLDQRVEDLVDRIARLQCDVASGLAEWREILHHEEVDARHG
ncbi:MAG TPA: hypothetical protein VH458_01530 [Vicinamibacterales bacterium]